MTGTSDYPHPKLDTQNNPSSDRTPFANKNFSKTDLGVNGDRLHRLRRLLHRLRQQRLHLLQLGAQLGHLPLRGQQLVQARLGPLLLLQQLILLQAKNGAENTQQLQIGRGRHIIKSALLLHIP